MSLDRKIFEYVAGSHLYGTNIATSDLDLRGVYIPENPFQLFESDLEKSDEAQDIKYFDLRKFLRLVVKSNPNILEALWIPKDKKTFEHRVWSILEEKRVDFLTKTTIASHLGYGISQIKKAKGANKRVVNPQPQERPNKEGFCWIIPIKKYTAHLDFSKFKDKLCFDPSSKVYSIVNLNGELVNEPNFTDFMVKVINTPSRPIPVSELGIDLSLCHAAKLEHVANTYRLYYYGESSKGIFRGDDTICLESIPMEDEYPRFIGLLIYDEAVYNRAVVEWKQYWEWVRNRNENRWIKQESGELDYDCKNIMHLFRLLYSAKSVLTDRILKIRFDGEELRFLMDVRGGKFKYEDLIKKADDLKTEIEELESVTTLPSSVDKNMVENIYKEMCLGFE